MTEESSSSVLVERVRSGHPDAIAELYARYAEPLLRAAYHLIGSAEDAEDILQDVFVGLPEAIKEYEHQETLKAWLKTLTVRASLMAMRTQARRREVPISDLRNEDADVVEPASPLDRMALERALFRLADPLRQVFVLKVVEGYSHEEIAQLLGITPGHSRVHLHRAREILEHRLRSSA